MGSRNDVRLTLAGSGGRLALDAHECAYPARTCLVLRNEPTGVGNAIMRRCEAPVYLLMYGKGRSTNVSQLAAVVAYRAVLG